MPHFCNMTVAYVQTKAAISHQNIGFVEINLSMTFWFLLFVIPTIVYVIYMNHIGISIHHVDDNKTQICEHNIVIVAEVQ